MQTLNGKNGTVVHINNVAVFDIDGTLSNDWNRRKLMPDWEAYHAKLEDDPPVAETVARFHEHKLQGCEMVCITARPERYRAPTLRWLERHDCSPDALLMRPEGDKRGSADLKEDLLGRLYLWESIVAVYDDRDDVLNMFSSRGVENCIKITAPKPYPAVPDILENMAATFRERNALYGNTYLSFGPAAKALWPRGLHIETEEEFTRLGFLVQCLNKLLRYASIREGHKDSAHDLAVYAAMLESVTEEP